MRRMRALLLGWATALSVAGPAAGQVVDSSFLPLKVGLQWVLRNPSHDVPVVFEVVRRQDDAYLLRSTNPWGASEWTLAEQNGADVMTSFGMGGNTMPLPDRPVFLDFGRAAGSKWTNSLGSLEIVSRSVTVRTARQTYRDCIAVRHRPKNGSQYFVFARGVGFVQYGEGKLAFVLDESSSRLAGSAAPPVPPVPPAPVRPPSLSQGPTTAVAPLLGLTPNRFATEPATPEVLIRRFQQTLSAGVNFLVANGTWPELEPRDGQYQLGDLHYVVSTAAQHNLALSYTLHVIDGIHKGVPADLRTTSWSDPKMRTRVLRLIEALAPAFQGRVRWFLFGYEIDGYLRQHAGEANDFIALYRAAAARMKQLVPGIQVGAVLTYSMGLPELEGRLASLNPALDVLALTYTPLRPDFTVEAPSALTADFDRMRRMAAGRKIVLQEIAYPSGTASRSSETNQAEFYRLAFQELAADRGSFAAVNFMVLADLGDQDTNRLASFNRLNTVPFRTSLQTLGLFDGSGRPKKAWFVFQENAARLTGAARKR